MTTSETLLVVGIIGVGAYLLVKGQQSNTAGVTSQIPTGNPYGGGLYYAYPPYGYSGASGTGGVLGTGSGNNSGLSGLINGISGGLGSITGLLNSIGGSSGSIDTSGGDYSAIGDLGDTFTV